MGEEGSEGAMERPIGTSTEGTVGDGVRRDQEAFLVQENQETWEERLGLDLGKMEDDEVETVVDSVEVVVIDEVAVLGAEIVVEVEENGGLEEEAVEEVEIEMTEFAIFVP